METTLEKVSLYKKNINDYKKFLSKKEFSELKSLTKTLSGKKIIHINATSQLGGGGVAELLHSLVPLQRSLGIDAEWHSIANSAKFFEITKEMHNGLQGKEVDLTDAEKKLYLSTNEKLALCLCKTKFDLVIIHDPQPLAIINFCHPSPMISRIHIDLSTPHEGMLSFITPYLKKYEKAIFSLDEFRPKGISKKQTEIISPAIDPLSEKNQALSYEKSRKILTRFGIDPKKPIISQVSRFDPWKDPIGVIDAYRETKKKIPGLQLILMGLSLAKDDPEWRTTFKKVLKRAQKDPNIYLFRDIGEIPISNELMVNAVQSGSDIILQKSTREGFGLVVTEAMWKSKTVIGGHTAGIMTQIKNGENGFIVKKDKKEAKNIANLLVDLLENSEKTKKIGERAKETVQKKFLITRLLKDHLKLYKEVLG